VNYYPRNLGDYAKDTGHLSALEHGVYNLLMDWYYANEQPIPESKCERIAKASTTQERKAVGAVLSDFFFLEDGFWRHSRIDAEIVKYKEKTDKAAESAKVRWDKERNANAMRPHKKRNARQSNANTEYRIQTDSKESVMTDSQFDALWSAYPKRSGSNPKTKALKALNARLAEGESLDAIAAGTERYRRHCLAAGRIGTEFVMQAARFFGPEKEYLNDWEESRGQHNQSARPHADKTELAAELAFGNDLGAEDVLEGDFERVDAHEAAH
jgi:uncharacterized protein YdaU (DUF1376 family)